MTPCRAFLKWAGGKFALTETLRQHLPPGELLVEPFAGAGSLFLNSDYPRYQLNDINGDLIALYQQLQQQPQRVIDETRSLFIADNNNRERYLALRAEFNAGCVPLRRAALFIYLNRFGYNGLCRYNKRGLYNVPFGAYVRPYFPEQELQTFAAKAQRCQFSCLPFEQLFEQLPPGAVVYCDPPYAPLSATATFTNYSGRQFTAADQRRLADCALWAARERGAVVLISNHDLPFTREIYQQAQLSTIAVRRSISRNGHGRKAVAELLALYRPAVAMTA